MILEQGADGVRAPLQARSRKTLDRIIRAGREIVAAEGAAAVTVQAVVARGRASVGSFYARFTGKDDLIVHMEALAWGELHERWKQALAGVSWSELELSKAVENFVGILSTSWSEGRQERRGYGARWGPREREFALQVRSAARDALLPHAREIAHPNPALALDLGARAVLAVLDAADDDEAGSDRLRRELGRLYLSYLTGPVRPGEERAKEGPVDYFDVWS